MMKFRLQSFLLLGVLLAAIVIINGHGTLFSFDGDVAQLWANNFTSVIHLSPRVWVVDYYLAWCGYCQRLAPDFAKFATDIKNWQPVVGVAAVACSDTLNLDLCRTYEVSGYPTIRMFPPDAPLSEHGTLFTGEKVRAVYQRALLNYLSGLVSQGRVHPSWPHLGLIKHLAELWQSGRRKDFVYVLAEDANSTASNLGLMVALDLLDMSNTVHVARMSLNDAHNYGASEHGLHGLTAFNQLYHINVTEDRDSIVSEIRLRSSTNAVDSTTLPSTTRGDGLTGVTLPVHRLADGLHMQDIESSLFYSLWVEVPSRSILEGSSLAALKKHISVMARFLPAESHIVNFLARTNRWLKTKTDALSSSEWLNYITNSQTEDAYVAQRVLWTWCRGSRPQLRGYPCSLWMTFHALTVSAYENERNNGTQSSDEVISSIRSYVEVFLGCRECARHFSQASSALLEAGNSSLRYRREGAVLWLWRAHNGANSRLAGDATEDPSHPKVQFPTLQQCSDCYARSAMDDELVWNEDRVLSFLEGYYGVDAIIDDDIHDNFNSLGDSSVSTTTTHSTPAQLISTTLTAAVRGDHLATGAAVSRQRPCPVASTEWTPCSKTCDVGTSFRMTNDNELCQTQVQLRLCQLRPCLIGFPDWNQTPWHRSNCARLGHTYRLGRPVSLQLGNCSTTALEQWTVCGRCPSVNGLPICCRPAQSDTMPYEVVCRSRQHQLTTPMMVEVIESCECDANCSPNEL